MDCHRAGPVVSSINASRISPGGCHNTQAAGNDKVAHESEDAANPAHRFSKPDQHLHLASPSYLPTRRLSYTEYNATVHALSLAPIHKIE